MMITVEKIDKTELKMKNKQSNENSLQEYLKISSKYTSEAMGLKL